MRKIPIALIILCSCKSPNLASPSSNFESCSVKDSEIKKAATATSGYVWDCTPSNAAIYPQAFMFKSDGTACTETYDLEGNLVTSSCESTFVRNSCSEIVVTHGTSITTLGSITAITGGFSTSMNIKIGAEDFGNQTYSCTLTEIPK